MGKGCQGAGMAQQWFSWDLLQLPADVCQNPDAVGRNCLYTLSRTILIMTK